MRMLAGVGTIFFIVFLIIAGLTSSPHAATRPQAYRVGVLLIGDAAMQ